MEKNYYTHETWGQTAPRTFLEKREQIAIQVFSHHSNEKNISLIDLGCGDGCFLEAVSQQFPNWNLNGVDGSDIQLSKAQHRIHKAQFKVANFNEPLPFDNETFDLVFAGEIIEHLSDPDFFLAEAYRILKPGGLVCLTTPNLLAWYNRLLMLVGISPIFVEYSSRDARVGYGILKGLKEKTPVGHLRIFHPDALVDALLLAGFKAPRLQAARFEYFPRSVRWLDTVVSFFWKRGGSLLIASAKKD